MKKKKEISVAPLTGSWMITSIVGFLISAFFVYERSLSWGFTFMLFFSLMFIAAMISMTYGPVEAQLHVGGKRYRSLKRKPVKVTRKVSKKKRTKKKKKR